MLIEWMQQKKVFATHEVAEWGFKHYFISADRRKRELMEVRKVKKLDNNEKLIFGYKCKDDVYTWVSDPGPATIFDNPVQMELL